MKMGEDLGLETGETKNADDDVRSSSDVIGFGEACLALELVGEWPVPFSMLLPIITEYWILYYCRVVSLFPT